MKKFTGWKQSFYDVINKHNKFTAGGNKAASYATQQQRHDVLLQGFRDLRHMNFKIKSVLSFRGTHMQSLVDKWVQSELSSATIQNRISVFRTFANWIGKNGMVEKPERYVQDPNSVKRNYVAQKSKTWMSQGVNIDAKLASLRCESARFADALSLQRYFGLRSKESLLLRPHTADKGHVLLVEHGSKGGRTRYIPIQTQEQRGLLDRIKGYIKQGASLVPKDKRYVQFRNQYYYILKKHGICRNEGITAHGLRHEHLSQLYKEVTGSNPPCDGGNLRKFNKVLDSYARQLVAERAGHAREGISSAYLGGKHNQR